jgi:RNA polymerase sigma-70 factor (ECF subfamily)
MSHSASRRLDTAVSLVIEDGRISRIYAVRNPQKLARLGEETRLSRTS